MIKNIINFLADPKYFFTLFLLCFFLLIKYIHIFSTKIFFYKLISFLFIVFVYFCLDENFYKIISLPDNVPIIFLNVLVVWFLWYSLYKGVKNDNRIENGLGPIEATPENREKVWVWPHLVYVELLAMLATLSFLFIWAMFLKAPLEEPANLTWAPNPAKAPWYFLGLQEMLVYFDPWIAGILIPGVIVVGLISIPYLDPNPKGNGYFTFKERKLAISIWLFGWLALWIFLIQIGTFLRGPNWTFYGPMEVWDAHKVVKESNVNFSEIIWIKLFRTYLPSNMFLREIPGMIFLFLYGFLGQLLLKKRLQSLKESMGNARFYIFTFLVLMMIFLPLKMYLRWIFDLKYILSLPELELNI
jgi:hypothetical protein